MLDNYISGEKKKISVNGIEYELQLFQGDHSNEYLLSEMKDGKVEGRCQLFNHGILCLAWMMKKGKRVGGITEYENGKVLQKINWDSVLGNGERKVVENTKEGMVMTIRCRCENENEDENEDENEEIVIYRGEFDDEMNRHGYGMEYDRESGKEMIEGYWEKDKLVRIVREFDADKEKMIEYAEKSSVEIWNRIPVYIGGYCIENGNQFVRNGVGYLIDKTSGTATRESEWEHGKEKSGGIDLYEGWYVEGMKESIRSVLKNDNPGEMKTKPIESVHDKQIEIHNSTELNKMNLKVTELIIPSNCCNDLTELDLNRFEWLESIEIGDECFGSVKTFKIDGLNQLKSLKIGKNSFTQLKKDDWNRSWNEARDKANNQSKSFHILNCKSLESIEIGEFSFSDFGGGFELKNLPSLQSIQIGTIGSNSFNFYCSSFMIRGILNDIENVMIRSS